MADSPTDPETGLLQSVRILLDGLVDYAGLFPPAKLEMAPTVRHYADFLGGPHAWMLGRLIVPVSRLGEFEQAAGTLLPREDEGDPWFISAIPGKELDADIDAIFEFNRRHESSQKGLVVVDTLEIRLDRARDVDRIMRIVPEQLQPFLEVPSEGDLRGVIASMAGSGAHAKIRCGGVTPDLFPSVERLAEFISLCAAAGVAFKATAGLHHPFRSEHALTYEPEAPRGVMHGFLNVFLASAFARQLRLDESGVRAMLKLTGPGEIAFSEEGVRWGDHTLDNAQIAQARESFAISFGSCSFDEPVEDLQRLSLI